MWNRFMIHIYEIVFGIIVNISYLKSYMILFTYEKYFEIIHGIILVGYQLWILTRAKSKNVVYKSGLPHRFGLF